MKFKFARGDKLAPQGEVLLYTYVGCKDNCNNCIHSNRNYKPEYIFAMGSVGVNRSLINSPNARAKSKGLEKNYYVPRDLSNKTVLKQIVKSLDSMVDYDILYLGKSKYCNAALDKLESAFDEYSKMFYNFKKVGFQLEGITDEIDKETETYKSMTENGRLNALREFSNRIMRKENAEDAMIHVNRLVGCLDKGKYKFDKFVDLLKHPGNTENSTKIRLCRRYNDLFSAIAEQRFEEAEIMLGKIRKLEKGRK